MKVLIAILAILILTRCDAEICNCTKTTWNITPGSQGDIVLISEEDVRCQPEQYYNREGNEVTIIICN